MGIFIYIFVMGQMIDNLIYKTDQTIDILIGNKYNKNMQEIAGVYYENSKLTVGHKVKFAEEKQAYTVRASNIAFAVCTKPFNPKKTVLYTVIDWHNNIRGTENLIFCSGAETDNECKEMLERLTQGESEISHRNNIELNITKLYGQKKKEKKECNQKEITKIKG